MQYRKALWRLALALWSALLCGFSTAQLVEERTIARSQVRRLSVSYVYNGRAYVATSSEVMLAIYDYNASPSLRGQINYPGNMPRQASAILVDGNYAYIHYEAGSQGKLAIVNVSNPDAPSLAGELTFPSSDPTYISMAKSGNYLYLFPYQNNFAVVDVSNPASPTLVRRVTATASAGVVVGNRLYTAEGANGVRIYDISQPDNPTLVNTISSVSNIGRVAAANGRLYALRSYNPPLQLHIFDLTNPDAPNLVNTYSTERVAGLAALGNFVFLSGFERGTEVLNVANPSAPQQVSTLPYHNVQNADAASGFALIQGQSIITLYNPSTNQQRRAEQPYPIRAEQRGNFVYAVQEASVVAFDVSNPSMPSVRGTGYLDTQRESNTDLALIGTSHIAVSSAGVLYIYDHTGNQLDEVARLDPGVSSTPGFGDRVRVSGDNLAMATLLGRVQLYDVSNPASPQPGGFITGSSKFDIQGNQLYAVHGGTPGTLRIYDIANLNSPNQVGSVNLPQTQFISDMATGSGYVLTSDWQGNLALVDVRTPSSPQVVAQASVAGVSNPRVAFDGAVNVFYVYDGLNKRVYMFRVSDFPNLNPISMVLNRTMYTLSFYGERVIGAGRDEGLIQYRNTLFGGPVVSVSGITPSRGANQGRLMVQVIGTGFVSGATVRLERGTQRLDAAQVQFVNNTRLDITFEFNGQPENTQWDVVVRNPDGQEGRLVNGFSIVEAVPQITSISPTSTMPLSSVTITINGVLITPDAQVILLPPDNISVNPITATNVEYLSQTRIRATFNLSPYQSLELLYSPRARVRVRNPNNRESNLVDLALNTPPLRMNVARSVEVSEDASTVTVEMELENAVSNEPLQVYLQTSYRGQARRVDASQVQSLGNNRWRVTFPATNLIPDNFAENWDILAQHLGTRTSKLITFYRAYAARVSHAEQAANIRSQAQIRVSVTSASPSTTVVLRQGERVIEPTSVNRRTNNWLVGVTEFELTYPIRLEDLGDWNAEVRYDSERTANVQNVLRITRGRPSLYNARPSSYLIWQANHQVVLEGNGFREGLRMRAVIENDSGVVDTRVIEADSVTIDENGQRMVGQFRFVGRLANGARLRYEVYSPYTETASFTEWRSFGSGAVHISSVWTPSFFRAGVGDAYTVLVSVGALPDAPIVVFPIPFTEQDLDSNAWDFEYRIREYSYYPYYERVLDEGRRALTQENALLIARLTPMLPFTSRYVEFRVRVIARGRAAQETPQPPQLRSRVPLAVYLAATGLLVLGSYVLDATCQFASWYSMQLAATIADAAGIEDRAAQRWVDWLLRDPRNAQRLLQLYTINQKSVFEHMMSALTQEAINEGGRALRTAASIASAQVLIQKFFSIPYGSDKFNAYRDALADAFVRAYDAYQRVKDVNNPDSSTEAAMATYQNAVDEINGLILQYAFGENVFEPPDGIDLSQFAPNTLGIILNTGLSTFLSTAADCIRRSEAVNQLYDRITVGRAPVRTSWDPNEKRGPAGLEGYIGAESAITYELLFENLASATAGAQEVLIEDPLPSTLDESTVEFIEVQVGNKRVALPENTTSLNTTLDLRPELPAVVRIQSEYNAATRTLGVRLSGLDPNTGNYYDPGFLPPNQTPPQGEGKVVFRIRPRSDAPSGTAIENKAIIIFDPHLQANPPIETNVHRLTLDKQPPSVRVEVPAQAIPETRAQLSWQATDDASGVDEVEIWAQEGENARRIGYTRAAGERRDQGRVTIRARRFGDETRILTRARDRVGNITPFSDQPVAAIRMGQPPRFSAGLHLIAVPLRPDASDVQPLFGFQNNQWATYNPVAGQYVQYPDANAAPAIGRGYWVALPNAVQPNLTGDLPDPELPYSIELQPGWNLIASPWTEPLAWHRNAVQVRVQGIARPLSEAGEFVEPYLWGWEPNPSNPQQGRYTLVYDAQVLPGIQNTLQPWRGYWIYAKRACTLELPTPDEAALFAGLTRSHALERNGGWSFRIGAQLGDSYDEVLLGVSGNDQGLQVAMPPAPPTRSALAGVQLRLVRDGTPMEAEIVPRSRRAPTWTLEVHAPPSQEERTRTMLITVPDIARLPRGVNPVLRDTQTGERRFLRNSAGWQLTVPREGLTRTYEISLVRTSQLLRITGLQVQPNRSASQHTIQFTLSDEARVSISVVAHGQVVRTLEQGRSRGRGVQQAVWDGRDAQGRALPPGSYQILVQAETEDGQVVRAAAPIILTR